MSTETEFERWLRRPEKSLVENVQFALKAWQSAEFTLATKYELITKWLVEECSRFTSLASFPAQEFAELLQLRAPPSAVTQATKTDFLEMMLKLHWTAPTEAGSTANARLLPELLQQVFEFELLQDLLRTDYILYTRLIAHQLKSYEQYLSTFTPQTVRHTAESEFFVKTIGALQNSVKSLSRPKKFITVYIENIAEPLVQVLLVLRKLGLCFANEFQELERHLTKECSDEGLLERILSTPLHVRLLMLESAIANRRGVVQFLKELLLRIFSDFSQEEPRAYDEEALVITVAAYTLQILHKHEINLNFAMTDSTTALTFIGAQILPKIQAAKDTHFREVLMLLCATLRLNPLILEQNVFQYTTWMIVAAKNTADTEKQRLFEEFLVLLLDMFRRLSRAEKLVVNLLKTIKEWLKHYKLPEALKKGKRKGNPNAAAEDAAPTKRRKQGNAEATADCEGNNALSEYLQIIFEDFYKQHKGMSGAGTANTANCFLSISQSFPQLESTWPSGSVGVAFARLVTGLMTKPSLVIWKTLIFSLQDVLAKVEDNAAQISDNMLFFIDLHAALLCQYFVGTRVSEQYEKFTKDVNEQRRTTGELLARFGQLILSHEHQQRMMNAFLECAYYAANFELLLAYYCPDGCVEESLQPSKLVSKMHDFLTAQEWTLVEQRVLNFGKSSCKYLLNRLLMQRQQAQLLLLASGAAGLTLQKSLLTAVGDEEQQLELILQSNTNAKWLVGNMERDAKIALSRAVVERPQLLPQFVDDIEMLELLTLAVYERLTKAFAASAPSKSNSLLVALNCDFPRLQQPMDANTMDKYIAQLIAIINERVTAAQTSLRKLPTAAVEQAFEVLRQLPVGQVRRQCKIIVFLMQLAVYRDLSAAEDIQGDIGAQAFDLLTDLLHFGYQIQIFKYFTTEAILHLLPVNDCWELYEFIFAAIKNEEKGAERFLNGLTEYLNAAQSASGKLKEDQRRLLLIAIENLGGISGPGAKRMRKYLDQILEVYAHYVNGHFGQTVGDSDAASVLANSKKDRKFVERTLAGFAYYAKALLAKANPAKAAVEGEDAPAANVDENFRRICKIYIGHSMDYRNPHAIRLMQVALNQRKQLHLDQDEIECVLNGYWRQLLADISAQEQLNVKNTESVVKMIIDHKTNEDLLLTLKDIGKRVDETDVPNVIRLLALIAKCPFSTIKGAIFNEQFKQIVCDITMRLAKDEHQQFTNVAHVLSILAAQQTITENKMVPLSIDALDSILAFLMDINLKKCILTEANLKAFKSLHLAMSDLCAALIKQRHILLMDRVPQFMHIFKDILQSLVWYKSERQKDTSLSPDELDDLVELAMKLEALMHIIATHSVAVKRVAPFVLTFAISLMVSNKRATTLYPQIKTHVESICYDLIGICDHRVGNFILRTSNEAARQVYESLVKEYTKYHKFKGKV